MPPQMLVFGENPERVEARSSSGGGGECLAEESGGFFGGGRIAVGVAERDGHAKLRVRRVPVA